MLNVVDAAQGIAGGMSGSPIIAENGTAIGIVCLGERKSQPAPDGQPAGLVFERTERSKMIKMLHSPANCIDVTERELGTPVTIVGARAIYLK